MPESHLTAEQFAEIATDIVQEGELVQKLTAALAGAPIGVAANAMSRVMMQLQHIARPATRPPEMVVPPAPDGGGGQPRIVES